jgi:hypothetical protein
VIAAAISTCVCDIEDNRRNVDVLAPERTHAVSQSALAVLPTAVIYFALVGLVLPVVGLLFTIRPASSSAATGRKPRVA